MAALRFATAALLLLPALAMLLVCFVYPVFLILLKSFNTPDWGFQNYQALWHVQGNVLIIRKTFMVSFWTTLFCLLIAYPFAYYVTTLPPRRAKIFLFLSMAPLFTAILARLYAWTVILGRRGVINEFLMSVGIIDRPLTLLFTPLAVTIGMVHVLLPYMILVLYSVMMKIDPAMLEASRTLGASPAQTFRRVFLPLSMRGVYAGCLLVFIVALGFFITPAVLAGGDHLTVSVYIEQQIMVLRWGTASAMASILLVVTIIMFVGFDRLFGAKTLMTGGLRK
ncbi:MAG TPA: ABC transporter permease [Pseudolabrys sp.]|nr:ABC transporter permease [Pseudolabrys sp.]